MTNRDILLRLLVTDRVRLPKELINWLDEEYIEPKVDWRKIDIDTKVLVRQEDCDMWEKGYFAYYKNNKVYTFIEGTTTKKSLKLPSGTISVSFEKEDFKPLDAKKINDSEALLEYCTENAKQFIETKQSVAWGELKKNLAISGDEEIKADMVDMESGEVVEMVVPPHTVYNKNTMEVVDCIGVEYVPSKIEVK